jgi:hypothetical protein
LHHCFGRGKGNLEKEQMIWKYKYLLTYKMITFWKNRCMTELFKFRIFLWNYFRFSKMKSFREWVNLLELLLSGFQFTERAIDR